MKKKIVVFLFDGFSDWEISYVTPEIHKSNNYELIFFSKSNKTVRSMGGLEITPTTTLSNLDIDTLHMLILPGGIAWEKKENQEISSLIREVYEKGKIIAGICAATVYLAQLGLLDNLNHTSNGLRYLKNMAPEYLGEENYQDRFVVKDKHLITATGTAPIEFAREVFKTLELFDDLNIDKWFHLFKYGGR